MLLQAIITAVLLPVTITEIESDGNKDSHPIPKRKLTSSAASSVTVNFVEKKKLKTFHFGRQIDEHFISP